VLNFGSGFGIGAFRLRESLGFCSWQVIHRSRLARLTLPHDEHFQCEDCARTGFSKGDLVAGSKDLGRGAFRAGSNFDRLQLTHTFRLAKLTLPHPAHSQLEGSSASPSGGLVAASTIFGTSFFGTKVGHAPGEGFEGGEDGCWNDCGDSSGSSSAMAYAAAGGRSECVEVR
jgi:hypothetical protein